MKIGQIIGETLKLYGNEYFFALSGGDHPLFLGLRDAGIKYILAHSERSAIAMADAYSRLTGKPSFAYGQWGPGAALCVSGVATAYWGHSALICINSSINSNNLYQYAYQGIDDQKNLFSTITKWHGHVPDISRLPDMLRTAIRVAVSGVPGPVYIEIPQELTQSEQDTPVSLHLEDGCTKFPAYRVAPESQVIEKAVALIAQANKPLILAGAGIIMSEAWDELLQFAENTSIPVVTSVSGKSAIASNHPLYVGVPGVYSRKVANEIVANCDTYIVIGSNLGDLTTLGGHIPPPETKIIHIDIDPSVLGTNYREALSIQSDAKLALKAMIEAAENAGLSKKTCSWIPWLHFVQDSVKKWRSAFNELAGESGSMKSLNPYFVFAVLNRLIRPDDVIVADTGYMAAYGAALIDTPEAGRKFIHATGSLGWALPASIGAQLATRGKGKAICIIGDGGIGYHATEIETAVRLNLPILVIVLNNSMLAFTYHGLKIKYQEIWADVTDYSDIDYGSVARACGALGERVTESSELEGVLRDALGSEQPYVVDIAIDKERHGPVANYEKFIDRIV